MKSRRLSEDAAYALLRKTVMNQNRTISDMRKT
jgi:AmiR/NasT family two-component response regulator